MNKSCPKCHKQFTCNTENIASCHCTNLSFTKKENQAIAKMHSGCLCKNCLEEIKTNFDKPARIYISFQDAHYDENLYVLSKENTILDSHGNEIELLEGKQVSVYEYDEDENNERDDLIACGIVTKNRSNHKNSNYKWSIKLDNNGIRFESKINFESLPEIIKQQQSWCKEKQLLYAENIAFAVTISIRAIWSEEKHSIEQKLEAIKHINEFMHHLVISRIQNLTLVQYDDDSFEFVENCIKTLFQNEITKGFIHLIIVKSFEKTLDAELPKFITSKEYFLLNQALNEICSGAYAIDKEEFHTLVGVSREEALDVLNHIQITDDVKRDVEENRMFFKYDLLRNEKDNSVNLQRFGLPIPENEAIMFSFEAPNYNRAMAIRNKFLDFEPYIPISENIVATRELTVFNENKKTIGAVNVTVLQPIKINENQWHCEYHINVELKGDFPNTFNLGGKNIVGFDKTQAIQNAFLIIDSVIFAYNDGNNQKIFWLEYGKDCGFLKK